MLKYPNVSGKRYSLSAKVASKFSKRLSKKQNIIFQPQNGTMINRWLLLKTNNSGLLRSNFRVYTVQKMKFSIKDFMGKCDQILKKLRIWPHLLKKSSMETSFFVQCHLAAVKNCLYNTIFLNELNVDRKLN